MSKHTKCGCGYAIICPWDRYCARCGDSLTTKDGASLVTMVDAVKVGAEDRASFVVTNRSRVTVNVSIPHIAPTRDTPPPDWLIWNRQTGNREHFLLAPDQTGLVSFDIDLPAIKNMLKAPGAGNMLAQFVLRLFVDADYKQQSKEVLFSLIGQADLRPAAVEFPNVWITAQSTISLPMKIFNASGEEMSVETLRTYTPQAEHADIVQALFPTEGFRKRVEHLKVPPGSQVNIEMKSENLAGVMKALAEKAPRFKDPYIARRPPRWKNSNCLEMSWVDKWPAITRVRFVVEATLKTVSGAEVPTVRSLVVLTLLRPPMLRDATPDDALWKVDTSSGQPGSQGSGFHQNKEGAVVAKDGEVSYLIADLINDSAFPIRVDSVESDKPWAQVYEAQLGETVLPGAAYLVKIKIETGKRHPGEKQEKTLQANISVNTTPPTPIPALDLIHVETEFKIQVPGWLGIDFGTSNCAVSYMPAASPEPDDPNAATLGCGPIVMTLEQPGRGSLPSLIVGRLEEAPAPNDPDLAFGQEAVGLEQGCPDNTLRNIKRILSTQANRNITFRRKDTSNPSFSLPLADIAERMIKHIVRQTETLARSKVDAQGNEVESTFKARLSCAANLLPEHDAHPSVGDIKDSSAWEFTHAVFSHPVDASDNLKRTLYGSAKQVGLAWHIGQDGAQRELTFEEFCDTRLVDESTAAITSFIHEHESRIEDLPKVNILCVDIGGGTTDISAMTYNPQRIITDESGNRCARKVLELWYRKGLNDFAGIDIDRALVRELFGAAVAKKFDDHKDTKGIQMDVELIGMFMEGCSRGAIEPSIRRKLNNSNDTTNVTSRVYQNLIIATTKLREFAETVKIAAGESPEGQTKLTLPANFPALRDGELLEGEERSPLIIEVPHKAVNELMGRMITARIPSIDDVVSNAGWTWNDVDYLMFTGQTSRAFSIREPIIKHVSEQRQGKPLTLVLPNLPDKADPQTHLEFDPKNCVPGGAALRGQLGKDAKIMLIVKKGAQYEIEGARLKGAIKKSKIVKGQRLPAAVPLTITPSEDQKTYAVFMLGGVQITHEVSRLQGEPMALVLCESGALYAVTTAPAAPDAAAPDAATTGDVDHTPTPDIPRSLVDAVRKLGGGNPRHPALVGPNVISFVEIQNAPAGAR